MAKRALSDWLTGYLKYTSNSEPPYNYHVWTGISMIASALQRKAYVRWGFETIYPNMYIVLVGPSGKCRKGTAINMGKDIITKVSGISITSESVTREALIRNMKDSVTNFADPDTNDIKFHASLMTISEELSVFLGQNDVKFLADLTDWYDSRDKWTYRTKGSGVDEIQGVCFNLLGATAPDWLQSILPQEAIGGGFTSRIIFVVEEQKGKSVPLFTLTKDEQDLRELLINDLERIHNLTGRYEFTEEAQKMYASWYERAEVDARKGKPAIDDPRFAGYCERRATHARKLCMILSASRGSDMMITASDFERSLSLLKTVEVRMPKVFGGLGTSQYSQITEKILLFIRDRRVVLRSELLGKFYRDMDTQTLMMIEDTLEKMKVISIERNPTAGDTVYKWLKK